MRYSAPMVAAALLLSACGRSAEHEAPRFENLRLAGYRATGEVRRCLPRDAIVSWEVVDLDTVILMTRSGAVYRNDLPYSCPGLMISEAFEIGEDVDPVCETDSLQVTAPEGVGALCGLGRFERLEPKKAERVGMRRVFSLGSAAVR